MNYYETLGVSRNSEPEVIDAAYRALMKKYHPDLWRGPKSQAEPRAQLINEAYATLRDPQRRRAYDQRDPHAGRAPPRPSAKRRSASLKPTAPRAPSYGKTYRRGGMAAALSWYPPRVSRALFVAGGGVLAAIVAIAMVENGSPGTLRAIGAAPTLRSAAAPSQEAVRRSFCVTNKTARPVDYSLYWGDTSARHYKVDPGYYAVHSSTFTAPPLIRFFDDAGVERAVKPAQPVAGGDPRACGSNHSFEAQAARGLSPPAEPVPYPAPSRSTD